MYRLADAGPPRALGIDIFPRPPWAAWADSFVHTIHLRVMRQIERLAERDP